MSIDGVNFAGDKNKILCQLAEDISWRDTSVSVTPHFHMAHTMCANTVHSQSTLGLGQVPAL